MVFNEESLPYVEIFLEETAEQLQKLEDRLILLEKNPEDQTCINDIFRIAHTLKGNAAMMGFEDMSVLAHRMEDLLDSIRKKKVHPSDEIIDTLLDALDMLKNLANLVSGSCNKDFSRELNDLIGRLEYLTNGGQNASRCDINKYSSNSPVNSEVNELSIKIDNDCLMKSARVFVILKELEKLVKIVEVKPTLDEIKEQEFKGSEIRVRFITEKNLEDLEKILQFIPDVKEVGQLSHKDEVTLNIKINSCSDLKTLKEQVKGKFADQVILDLTNLSELNPIGLSQLIWVRNSVKTEFILPKNPMLKEFLELLGFKETIIKEPATTREAWQKVLSCLGA